MNADTISITEVELRRLNPKAGEILMFTFPETATMFELDKFRNILQKVLPAGVRAIMTLHKIQIDVVGGSNDGRESTVSDADPSTSSAT